MPSFERNFANTMAQAGNRPINLPAFLPIPAKLAIWANFAGSMAYYYVYYDLSSMDFSNFPALKDYINSGIESISARNNMRHSVIFNIIAGEIGDNAKEIEKMIDAPGEFALLPIYDIYYGVDIFSSKIMRNSKQPPNMDGALDKIKSALDKAKEVCSDEETADTPERIAASRYAVPVVKIPFLFYIIMAANLIMFVLMELSGGSANMITLLRHGAAAHYLIFTHGQYYRLITPIFLHIGITHLIFNSMSLILFGARAEKYFGHIRFFIIYIISGISGNLAMVLTSQYSVGAGASGSIFGIIGAIFAFTKVRKKNMENFNASSLGIMIIIGVLMGFTMSGVPDMPNVANSAHIGGLAAGFLLGLILTKRD